MARVSKKEIEPTTKHESHGVIFDRIVGNLLQKVDQGLDNLTPYAATDMLGKITLAYERWVNIEKAQREANEAISGTSRRIIFDWTITAPREPGNPDEPNG